MTVSSCFEKWFICTSQVTHQVLKAPILRFIPYRALLLNTWLVKFDPWLTNFFYVQSSRHSLSQNFITFRVHWFAYYFKHLYLCFLLHLIKNRSYSSRCKHVVQKSRSGVLELLIWLNDIKSYDIIISFWSRFNCCMIIKLRRLGKTCFLSHCIEHKNAIIQITFTINFV